MINFGTKVKSLVRDSGRIVSLKKGNIGVIVECNSDGTFDVYFPTVEGKLRTLKPNEIESISDNPMGTH